MLAQRLAGLSYADLEQFALEVARTLVLLDPPAVDLSAVAETALQRWAQRLPTHKSDVAAPPHSWAQDSLYG